MTRLAIAGLGAVTRNIHLLAYRKLREKVSLVGGCDPDAEACSNFSKHQPDTPVFKDFDEMLRTAQPDIVAICTPPFLHHAQCLAALKHGCHVFCEKPMVETLAEADEIIASANAAGRTVVTNSQFPFMNIHTAAKSERQN
jgi:predicted dehydrogenase